MGTPLHLFVKNWLRLSGKNRSEPDAALHTSFKLSSSGEFLALVDSTGQVATAFDPAFPPLREDVSFGVAPEDVQERAGFLAMTQLETPTPGAENSAASDAGPIIAWCATSPSNARVEVTLESRRDRRQEDAIIPVLNPSNMLLRSRNERCVSFGRLLLAG